MEDKTHPSNIKKKENTVITKIHKHKAINGDEKLAAKNKSNGNLK